MKNVIFSILAVFLIIACENNSSPNNLNDSITNSEIDGSYLESDIDVELLKSELSGNTEITEEEKAGLLHMREEEKLARDVYNFYAEKYGLRIFANIAKSEENHMSAVKILLDQFGLEDPVLEEGKFSDQHLQELYEQLTSLSDDEFGKAIFNGLLIEDLDIYDLEELINNTANPDIILVYGNLLRASENHLRAFYRQAQNYNVEYTVNYISQERFDEIISSSRQSGKSNRWRGGRNN